MIRAISICCAVSAPGIRGEWNTPEMKAASFFMDSWQEMVEGIEKGYTFGVLNHTLIM